MSDSRDALGLVELSVFERVAGVLQRLIDDGLIELRFARGGSFRASVVKELLSRALQIADVTAETFDAALSEIVLYLNALVFEIDDQDEVKQLAVAVARRQLSPEEISAILGLIPARKDFVKQHVRLEGLRSRAQFRLHSITNTFDTINWSINQGSLKPAGMGPTPVSIAGIALTLFQPSDGQKSSVINPFNFADLIMPKVERIYFSVDEHDVDELIQALQKLKTSLSQKV